MGTWPQLPDIATMISQFLVSTAPERVPLSTTLLGKKIGFSPTEVRMQWVAMSTPTAGHRQRRWRGSHPTRHPRNWLSPHLQRPEEWCHGVKLQSLDHWWFWARWFFALPSNHGVKVNWDDYSIPNWMENHKIHVPNISKPPTSIPNQVQIDHASRDWHPVRSFLSLRTYFTKLRKRVKHLLNCRVECWTNTRWVCSMNKSNTGWASPT